MQHTPVESSHIVSAAYDPRTQTMELKFKNGSTYRYKGVSQDHYQGFMDSDSKGDYHHQNIKNAFESTKQYRRVSKWILPYSSTQTARAV